MLVKNIHEFIFKNRGCLKNCEQYEKKLPRLLYIAIDVDIPSSRGSFTHTYEIANNLCKKGMKVYVVGRRRNFSEAYKDCFRGIPVFRLFRRIPGKSSHQYLKKYRRQDASKQKSYGIIQQFFLYLYKIYLRSFLVAFSILFLIKIIKKYKIDIILERGSSLGAGVLASRITKRPAIVEIIDDNHSFISLKLAQKIIIYSQKVLKCSVPENKLVKVTAAANTELFNPDINPSIIQKKYLLKEKYVIGYAGNFEQWHGVLDLVCAADQILQSNLNVAFLLVGSVTSEVIHKIHATGRDESFILPGPVNYFKVPMYLAAADILVAPFNPDGAIHTQKFGYIYSPIKVFEYMAMGKPVIASDLPHIKNVIRTGIDGILISPGNPHELANTIIKLLMNAELRKMLSNNARKRVLRYYSWEKLTIRFFDLIISTLSEINKK